MEFKRKDRQVIEYGIVAVLSVLGYLILMWIFTGRGPFSHNTYNSYALQAEAWTRGHLDLGENYSYLELAIFNGKYYVSFPPFPSYILFPLAFIFGSNTPDHLLIWIEDLVTVVYLYRLALRFIRKPQLCALTAIFVMLGTNATFNLLNPWVWFAAQTLCFMLAVMAIWYACEGKGGLSLFLWACSVGCRPMQALFLPVFLIILYGKECRIELREVAAVKKKKPVMEEEEDRFDRRPEDVAAEVAEKEAKMKELSESGADSAAEEAEPVTELKEVIIRPTLLDILKKRWKWAIPAGIVALSYMILNYARFGSITEFGHNYLPEFMEAEHGQFDLFYLKNNFHMLLNLPSFDGEKRMEIDHFGNLNFMIASPFIIFALAMIIVMLVKKQWKLAAFDGVVLVPCSAYLFVTIMPKTMGGWHFGNRYTNDILPWLYLTVALALGKAPEAGKYQIPVCIFGMCLNAVGLVVVYNGMYIV
ncbi:MAG: hypothetical protein K6F53_05625 [Lachnospiraceae bacterium]|nr:hypothetical protein [Lachnospiraceae bacterium]